MSDRVEVAPRQDPWDPEPRHRASGLLAEHNAAGVLDAADVHVALRLGRLGHESDERVLLAAALAVRAVRAGSVCLDLAGVPERGSGPDVAGPGPVGGGGRCAARWWARARRCTEDGGTLYLDRYWQEETQVVEDLGTRSSGPAPSVDEAQLGAALERVLRRARARRPAGRGGGRLPAAGPRSSTGGPGTGKTTTVARLLGVLLSVHAATGADQPLRVALAAPTGKAAARMAQAVRDATGQPGFPGAEPGRRATRWPWPSGSPPRPRCTACSAAAPATGPASATTAATACRTTSSSSTRRR